MAARDRVGACNKTYTLLIPVALKQVIAPGKEGGGGNTVVLQHDYLLLLGEHSIECRGDPRLVAHVYGGVFAPNPARPGQARHGRPCCCASLRIERDSRPRPISEEPEAWWTCLRDPGEYLLGEIRSIEQDEDDCNPHGDHLDAAGP